MCETRRRHCKKADLFEEQQCDLVRNFQHLYDVTLPRYRDKQMLQSSCTEIGQKLNVRWTVVKERCRSVRDPFVGAHNKSMEWSETCCQSMTASRSASLTGTLCEFPCLMWAEQVVNAQVNIQKHWKLRWMSNQRKNSPSSCHNVFNGLTDRCRLQHYLCFCLFSKCVITTSSLSPYLFLSAL